MERPTIRLLGGIELRDAQGRELRLPPRKARALLAFLAVEAPRWHSRDRLAGMLWGRHAATQARNSLNQTLHEIRKLENAAGACFVARDGERLRLAPDAVECDLHRFDALLATDPLPASELYQGDLLEDFELAEEGFADWLGPRRSHYRALLADALLAAAAAAADGGDLEAGTRAARRLVDLEPLDERARRQLMRLLADSGNRGEALRQFRVCEDLLREELGVEPEPQTRLLAEALGRGHPTPQPATAPGAAPGEATRPPEPDRGDPGGRPVVAVLPFDNMSDDADAVWLAEGLAEDLIFELSAFRWFRVLARTSTFHVRDRLLDHEDARRVLGATYLVSGRVRRAGGRLRVNVALVDCVDGGQLWAGRYDRTLDDLFEVEADIAREVVAAIEPSIEGHEMRRALRRPPETLAVYERLQRGYWHLYQGTAEDRVLARRFFEAAAASDPSYACAVAALAGVEFRDALADVVNDGFRGRMETCRDTAEQALLLDPWHPFALRFLSGAANYLGDQQQGLAAATRAVELCPSFATGYSALAFSYDFLGNFDDARPAADETVRLRPHDPALHKCILSKAIADYQTGDYAGSERVIRDSLRTNGGWWMSNMMLAATVAQAGRRDEALAPMERIRADQPGITLEIMLDRMPFMNGSHCEHLADGLQRAGWRDEPAG